MAKRKGRDIGTELHGCWVKDGEDVHQVVSRRAPMRMGGVYGAALMDGALVRLKTYGDTREHAVEALESGMVKGGWKMLVDADGCSDAFDPLSNVCLCCPHIEQCAEIDDSVLKPKRR